MRKYLIQNALPVATNTPFPVFPCLAGKLEASLGRHRSGWRKCLGLLVAQVAGDVVAGEDFAHCRLLLGAAREGVGAAGVEAAAEGPG